MNNSKTIRLVLAEDHAMVRTALVRLLDDLDRIEVVGEAADGVAALEVVDRLKPDILLLDLTLPHRSGTDVLRQLSAEGKLRTTGDEGCRVVVLTMHGEDDIVTEAFALGAAGYVLKDEAEGELIDAILRVSEGEVHLSPRASQALVTRLRKAAAEPSRSKIPSLQRADTNHRDGDKQQRRRPGRRLTPREREVLTHVVGGLSTKEVAVKLGISPKTVDAHRQAVMRKLEVHDVASLVRNAIKHGYVEV
ncbi:MAG: response regulator [Planctomycetota bacterium]|jgi:DNA-binding NarL/FixJ family response regulator